MRDRRQYDKNAYLAAQYNRLEEREKPRGEKTIPGKTLTKAKTI